MPMLEATDEQRITPKSILRHRPVGLDALLFAGTPVAQRASRPRGGVVEDEVREWKRGTGNVQTGAMRTPPVTRQTTTATKSKAIPQTPRPQAMLSPRKQRTIQAPPLLYLGLGMIAMLMLWVVLSAIFGWVTTMLDDLHYGRPRTFQTDAWVGHNEQTGSPSHFIALNLNRHIEIIEISGGDAARTKIYTGPELYNTGDDLVPVTLRFLDVNGDGKPDMIVTFSGSRVVFINENGSFRPMVPSERHQVEQVLQHQGL